MKRQNLLLIINAMIILIVSLGLILYYASSVVKTPEDRLFGQVVSLTNEEIVEEVPSTSDYAIVHLKYDAENRKGDSLGTVYNLKIRNSYKLSSDDPYGLIELLLAITNDNKVSLEIITVNQSSWTIKGIQRFIYDKYSDILRTDVVTVPTYDAADIDAGATATDSTGAIRDLVKKAVEMHYGEFVDDPLIEFYGEGYIMTEDLTFNGTLVTNKYSIQGKGSMYVVTNTGPYEGYDGTHTGPITMQVLFDNNDKIIAILFPAELYGHTASYLNRNNNYMELFIGLSISEIQNIVDANDDLKTGATGSKELVESLLEALVSEVNAG